MVVLWCCRGQHFKARGQNVHLLLRRSRSGWRMATQTPPATSRQMNIVYGISNLANYIVGAGILGLPFVFSKTGWAAGCFLILLAAFATALSFDFLLRASTASGCYSYDALALRTGGTRLQKVRQITVLLVVFLMRIPGLP